MSIGDLAHQDPGIWPKSMRFGARALNTLKNPLNNDRSQNPAGSRSSLGVLSPAMGQPRVAKELDIRGPTDLDALGGNGAAPGQLDASGSLVLDMPERGTLRIRWSVSAGAWAGLDAEFPARAGVTRPILRLRQVGDHGLAKEIACKVLGSLAMARSGLVVVPGLTAPGDYEAELGLASDDGGWLMLLRSALAQPVIERAGPPTLPSSPRIGGGEGGRRERASGARVPTHDPSTGNVQGWGLLPEGVGAPPLTATAQRNDSGSLPMLGGHGPDDPVGQDRAEAGGLPPPASSSPTMGEAQAVPPRSMTPGWAEGPAAAGYGSAPRRPDGLEVRAEIVVYGSAPPKHLVDLYGRPLQVGPGGGFALRFALTDPHLLRQALAKAQPLAPGETGPGVDED